MREILKMRYILKYLEKHNKKWLIMYISMNTNGGGELVHLNEVEQCFLGV